MSAAHGMLGHKRGTRHDIARTENGVGGYEAHITFAKRDAESVKALALTSDWKFSQIDGDPVMGAHVFCYLSAYSRSQSVLMGRMTAWDVFLVWFGLIMLTEGSAWIAVRDMQEKGDIQ